MNTRQAGIDVVAVLRQCRKMALDDCEKYGPDDNYCLISKARSDAYMFALSLLEPNGPEATEWNARMSEIDERYRQNDTFIAKAEGDHDH